MILLLSFYKKQTSPIAMQERASAENPDVAEGRVVVSSKCRRTSGSLEVLS
jgi:hypothetical protein